MTMVIAHRGASAQCAENTLEAFERAVVLGADGVELDVRRTADDQLVVHHDAVLADGRAVRDTLRHDLPGEVPDLSDALAACSGVFVNVEIKNDPSDPDFDTGEWVANRLVAELSAGEASGEASVSSLLVPSVLVSSFRHQTVGAVRRLAPTMRTALLTIGCGQAEVEQALAGGHVAIHPYVELLCESDVRRAHAAGLAVNTWTCNDPGRMRELMRWGVDGVCTDVPDVALAVRRGDRVV